MSYAEGDLVKATRMIVNAETYVPKGTIGIVAEYPTKWVGYDVLVMFELRPHDCFGNVWSDNEVWYWAVKADEIEDAS